jgi:catechol 2,3-dioxygenase
MQPLILIDPMTHLGVVSLTVADLTRSLHFYGDVLGLSLTDRTSSVAVLSAGETPLVELVELPGAQPKPARATGLYHFAILVPSRADLARSLRRLAEMRWPMQGAADHLVSEALYLADPDGNGIEIYRDRARSHWPLRGGQVQMATDPLDVEGVLGELGQEELPWQGLPVGTSIGHIHLHVADLREAEAFYCGVLGFEVMQRGYPGALFVAAGGYHHHVGLNVWAGSGAPPQPAGTAGLRYATMVLPDLSSLERLQERLEAAKRPFERRQDGCYVSDPSRNQLRLVVGE